MKHRFLISALLCFQFSFSQSGLELNLDSLFSSNGISRVHTSTWIQTDSNMSFIDSFPNFYVLDNTGKIVSQFYGIGMLVYKTKSYSNDKLIKEVCFESISKGSRHVLSDSLPCLDTSEYKDTFYVKTYIYNESGKLMRSEKNGIIDHEIIDYEYNKSGLLDRTYFTTIEQNDTTTIVNQLFIYNSKGVLEEIRVYNSHSETPSETWSYKWKKGKIKSIKVTFPENDNYNLFVFDKKGLVEREIFIWTDPHWGGKHRTIVTYYRDKNGLILRRNSYSTKDNIGTTIQFYHYE